MDLDHILDEVKRRLAIRLASQAQLIFNRVHNTQSLLKIDLAPTFIIVRGHLMREMLTELHEVSARFLGPYPGLGDVHIASLAD